MGTLYEISANGNRKYTGSYLEDIGTSILTINAPSQSDLDETNPADPDYCFTGIDDVSVIIITGLTGNRDISWLPAPTSDGKRLLLINGVPGSGNRDIDLEHEDSGSWATTERINNANGDVCRLDGTSTGSSFVWLIYAANRWRTSSNQTW